MVDFKKHLGKAASTHSLIDPVAIYSTLDRQSDKGPLRPAQEAVLKSWHQHRRSQKDVILKLHTGQGKTLIGLLMLQSKLNEKKGPALYLTPNKFLAQQTREQADQFGIKYTTLDRSLPHEFLDSKLILITHAQKLFHGKSTFGIGAASEHVESIVVDDSHACIDAIRQAFIIRGDSTHPLHSKLLDLFGTELEKQGAGTFQDINNHVYDSLLPVPYWDWHAKTSDVAAALAKHSDTVEVKFVWPLLKDMLQHCQCLISGQSFEIGPYVPPLDQFGSFHRASHRVFMSATVSDDSFFVKGLGLSRGVITAPLMYDKEKWSGEKMVLIPSLIDEALNRQEIVKWLGPSEKTRSFGIVVLAPSFAGTKDWKAYGARVANTTDIDDAVASLRAGEYADTLVIANRYDGIDLPDQSCRLLVIDSRPRPESLWDRYVESVRPGSDVLAVRVTRAIEQGLGRSVRGEKDYCAIVLIGPELIKHVRLKDSEAYFSDQTRTQIEIGHEIAELAREDIAGGLNPLKALTKLIGQCTGRDSGWKEFYVERMDAMSVHPTSHLMIDIFATELAAEQAAIQGDWHRAADIIQGLADTKGLSATEKGWYVQEKARYTYPVSASGANAIQIAAHRLNKYLLRPKSGMVIERIAIVSHRRVENVAKWVQRFERYQELMVAVDEMLARLQFGVNSDRFEEALHNIGEAIGFVSQRPDREWKEGPDVLWAVTDNDYLLFECKNEVQTTRPEINKAEAAQMNTSIAWFKREYKGATYQPMMVIPASRAGSAAALSEGIGLMRVAELRKFGKAVRGFFGEFHTADFTSLSGSVIQAWLDQHNLSVPKLKHDYSKWLPA